MWNMLVWKHDFLVILEKYSVSFDLKMHFFGFSPIFKKMQFSSKYKAKRLFFVCFHLKITYFLHEIVMPNDL